MTSFKTLENPADYIFETVACYHCGSSKSTYFLTGQEDLTGKPGNFRFVKCSKCALVYQNPRIHPDQIKDFYDDEYIAHRKQKDWGILTPLYNRAMNKHDRDKIKIVSKYKEVENNSRVLDVGCAVGTFLLSLKKQYGCHIAGVDFKDLRGYPDFDQVEFYNGLFYEQSFDQAFDLITMWHFLEHCYAPIKSLTKAAEILAENGRLIIEVPRLDSFSYKLFQERWPGIQAPQHTVMFTRQKLLEVVDDAGLQVVDYLPYGAFPPYFYLFAGTAFKFLKGKGLDLNKVIAPYFIGQLILLPLLLFSKKLNLAMQTVICKKK
jgi:SAM-dependent methyltransferase